MDLPPPTPHCQNNVAEVRTITDDTWQALKPIIDSAVEPFTDVFERGRQLFAEAKSQVQRLSQRFAPKLTEEERTAATFVKEMLAEDKLGGQDGTFNHSDIDAITEGVLKDRQGLRKVVVEKLLEDGEKKKADAVDRAFRPGAGGFINTIARTRATTGARVTIKAQLKTGLEEAGIQPSDQKDGTERNLTFEELDRFQASLKVLEKRQEETAKKLGLKISFPDGPSAAAMDFLLQGRIGIPPGAKIELAN